MKKLNLLFAASLLAFGLNVQAQDRMWGEDFEAGLGFFTDSVPADYIYGLEYYIGRDAGNGTWDESKHTAGFLKVDTIIELYHAIAPVNNPSQRIDVVSVEYDPSAKHQKELTDLGGIGGHYYLQYVSGPSQYTFNQWGGAPGVTNDYEANVFVRGLPIEDGNSYRVSYYMMMHNDAASKDSAQVDLRLMRGWYNSEMAFALAGSGNQGKQFTQTVKSTDEGFQEDKWKRYTYMTYYTNDSIANNGVHANGYWWVDEWRKELWARRDQFDMATIEQFMDSSTYEKSDNAKWGWIKQPDTYFLRFSFQGPHSLYQIDDIELYNSWIGGAESNVDIIRVNFGYQTNLIDIANSNGIGQIEVPTNAYKLVGYDDLFEEYVDFSDAVYAAEFHKDGYLYLWIDFSLSEDEVVQMYETLNDFAEIYFDFHNSILPADMQLKYTGDMFPRSEDAEWCKTKLVPDFEGEIVHPNIGISAVPVALLPPSVVTTDPENGAFGLNKDKGDNKTIKNITVNFNKPVYAKDVTAAFVSKDKSQEIKATNVRYINDAKTSIMFDMPVDKAGILEGDSVYLTIQNAKALNEAGTAPAEGAKAGDPYVMYLFFGDAAHVLADAATLASINYTLLTDAYEAAQVVVEASEDPAYGGPARDAFIALFNQSNPEALLEANYNPSVFKNAAEALDAATKAQQDRMTNVDAYKTIVSKANDMIDTYAEMFGDMKVFKDLQAVMAKYGNLDVPSLSNEELAEVVKTITDAYNNCNVEVLTYTVTTRQIKGLAALNEELGVELPADIAAQVAAVAEDNQKLAQVLKLEAKKAIYTKLAGGATPDSLDVTDFITNASLYFTGVLGKEIKEEWYSYASCNRYVLNSGVMTTVFPGWAVECTAGSVPCGYGDERGGISRGDADGDHGGYVQPGKASEGHIAADWTSGFVLEQVATDLPNGIFTLTVDFGGGEDNIANQYLTANGDSVKADAGQYEVTIALDGVTVDADSMAIKMEHKGVSAWARADNFHMYMTGALEGFDYGAAAAEVDKQIQEAVTIVDPVNASTEEYKYYNLNGVKVEAAKGVVIRVAADGTAEKVLY